MNRRYLGFGILFFVSLTLGAQQPRVGVVDFDVKGRLAADSGGIFAEMLGVQLQKSGRYALFERSKLEQILKEQELGLTNLVDQTTLAQVGKLTGVQFLTMGSLAELSGTYLASARLVNVETGEIMESGMIKGVSTQDLMGKVESLALQLQGKKPMDDLNARAADAESWLFTSILRVTGDPAAEVVLAIGSRQGIGLGDKFKLFVPRYETSKITGKSTFMDHEQVGFLTVNYVEPGMCTAAVQLTVNRPGLARRLAGEGLAQITRARISPVALEVGVGFDMPIDPFIYSLKITGGLRWEFAPNLAISGLAGVGFPTSDFTNYYFLASGLFSWSFMKFDMWGMSGAVGAGATWYQPKTLSEGSYSFSKSARYIFGVPVFYELEAGAFMYRIELGFIYRDIVKASSYSSTASGPGYYFGMTLGLRF